MIARRGAATIACLVLAIASLTMIAPAGQNEWIDLFNGKDFTGWRFVNPDNARGWRVESGYVISQPPSSNIVTDKLFKDFDLHCEYQVPPGSNGGIYILNRYEVQIQDDYQKPIQPGLCGSIYRQILPTVNACKPPAKNWPTIAEDEWQTFDVNFRAARFGKDGRKTENARATVVHNGIKIIADAEITEPTGAARRFDEEAMGPILLQADHGPVAFRNFRVRGELFDPPDPKTPGPDVVGAETELKELAEYKAPGVAVTWRTPYNAYASAYRVYRGESPDFPLDEKHLRVSVPRRQMEDCCFETDGTYYYRIVALGPDGVDGKPSVPIKVTAEANQVRTPYLAEASWARSSGQRVPIRNRLANRRPMSLHGRKFDRAIGMVGSSQLRFYVRDFVRESPDYRFRATVGMDDSVPLKNRDIAAAQFMVEVDDRRVFDSGRTKWADGPKEIDLPLPAGTRKVVLIVRGERQRGSDCATWGDPRLEKAPR